MFTRMCLSSTQPGGPRRCSGDTRAVYQRSAVAVAELEHTCRHLEAAHVVRDATPAAPVSAAESQWAVCGTRHRWTVIGEGHYGRVFISPDGTRAVKELLDGRSFGDHEVHLAITMGDLGHSPRIFAAGDRFIEMEVAAGAPLWVGYTRGEDEPVMTTAQAAKAAAAICALHNMGAAGVHRGGGTQ